MRKTLAFLMVTGVISMSAFAVATQQPAPRSAQQPAPNTGPTVDDVLKAVRGDLQSERADILAKNMTLTSDQAAKFWPVYAEYQKQQNVIMDDQMKAIQKFVDTYNTLDDAGAVALINGHFDRDARMNELRKKWFGEFQKVLPTKLAVRAMQIDRRLSLAHQIEFAARIPLSH